MAKKRRPIPHFREKIIETHCHLDYLEEPLSEVFLKMREHNIGPVVTIAVEPQNLKVVRELAQNHPHVYCTQGIHPHDARQWSEEVEKEIVSHLADKKTVAVGEIGLDYYYLKSPREKQIDAFRRQLEIAIDHDMPVVIHSRDAEDDTIQILQELGPELKGKGVIHSFTSDPRLAHEALSLGFSLGFNGIITFKKVSELREVVRETPLENILLETDSPFLTPEPYRGKKNAPYYLPFVAEKIAEIKDLEVSQVIRQTTFNAQNLFTKIDAELH